MPTVRLSADGFMVAPFEVVSAGEDVADHGDYLRAVELDGFQSGAHRQRAGRVDQVEPTDAQPLDGAGDPAGDGLRRADVHRAVYDVGVEFLAAERRPAAQRPDPVAGDLVPRVEQLLGLLVGVGDEARR